MVTCVFPESSLPIGARNRDYTIRRNSRTCCLHLHNPRWLLSHFCWCMGPIKELTRAFCADERRLSARNRILNVIYSLATRKYGSLAIQIREVIIYMKSMTLKMTQLHKNLLLSVPTPRERTMQEKGSLQ